MSNAYFTIKLTDGEHDVRATVFHQSAIMAYHVISNLMSESAGFDINEFKITDIDSKPASEESQEKPGSCIDGLFISKSEPLYLEP